jgi:hypothetical protein
MEDPEKPLRSLLPKEWVTRKYRPDYGIDFAVEVFEYVDEKQTIARRSERNFSVQLKLSAKTTINTLRVHPRDNVAKRADAA